MSKIDVGVAIIEKQKKFLVGKKVSRPGNFLSQAWHFPGGKVDPGETIQQGLIREVKEETNLDIIKTDFLGTTHTDEFRIHYFKCVVKDVFCLQACDDLQEVVFLPAQQILQICPPHVQAEWPENVKVILEQIANDS